MNLNESIKIMANEIISYFRLFEGGMLSADAFLPLWIWEETP
jgi:hypothetical protein